MKIIIKKIYSERENKIKNAKTHSALKIFKMLNFVYSLESPNKIHY